MKINWFSPLPPAGTGVAEYAAHLLPALCDRAEVVVWTDQERCDVLDARAEVRRYQPDQIAWADLNRADLSVYHVGNNQEHHGGPWLVSRRQPGLVVLHDVSLPHFFVNLYRQRLKDRAGYCAHMERVYGANGRALAAEFWDHRVPPEYVAERCPLTELAVEGALGVFVHTPAAYEELKPRRRWPLACHPLAYRATPRPAPPPRDGMPYQLIVFGHISANRRLEYVLEALAHAERRDRFHLHVYGSLWDPRHIEQLAKAPALRGRVTLHGYVADAELDAALASAHLAINLRFPTLGEGSISQLRIWDHALPTLVSRVGWYATLPASAVAHVRPGHEVEDVRRHLDDFLRDPAAFARMGECGRRYLQEHHAPGAYVEALLGLCEEARQYRPRALSYYLAERAGAEMSAWCTDSAKALRPVAGQIARLVA